NPLQELIMKRLLTRLAFALGAAALLSLAGSRACADEPGRLPVGRTDSSPASGAAPAPGSPAPGTPTPGAPVVVAPPPAACVPEACARVCEAPCRKKVCTPETAPRQKVTRCYGETCEDFCVPKCPHPGLPKLHHHDDCDACPAEGQCPSCENCVRQKKFLIVK